MNMFSTKEKSHMAWTDMVALHDNEFAVGKANRYLCRFNICMKDSHVHYYLTSLLICVIMIVFPFWLAHFGRSRHVFRSSMQKDKLRMRIIHMRANCISNPIRFNKIYESFSRIPTYLMKHPLQIRCLLSYSKL